MKNQAITLIAKMKESHFCKQEQLSSGMVAIDNNDTINFLNDNCTEVVELCRQETWVMTDGSYITRNDDLYFSGDDICEFEITHDDWMESCKQI